MLAPLPGSNRRGTKPRSLLKIALATTSSAVIKWMDKIRVAPTVKSEPTPSRIFENFQCHALHALDAINSI
jgi:hypothetical protein